MSRVHAGESALLENEPNSDGMFSLILSYAQFSVASRLLANSLMATARQRAVQYA